MQAEGSLLMKRWLRMPIMPAIALAMLSLAGGARGADCVLDNNPACPGINLGTFSGDAGTPAITRSGTGEAFFTVYVKETSSVHPRPLNARVTLQVPAGMDYDLIVRCANCSSSNVQTQKKGIGSTEIVNVTRSDTFSDNSFWIVIEVRYYAGTGCGPWQLTISGNTAATQGALTCS